MDDQPRRFHMIRENDATGISGTGRVLDGGVFYTGQVVVCWRSRHSSITIYASWEDFLAVHITPHPENHSRVVFLD